MVDWLIMLDLVLLSAYFVNFNQLNHNEEKPAAIVLLILPFAYFGLYMIAKIIQILWLVHVYSYSNLSLYTCTCFTGRDGPLQKIILWLQIHVGHIQA